MDTRGDLDKRTKEVLVSWEDNETRKGNLSILVISRKRTTVNQSQGKIGSTSFSSAAGACKAALSD
jgi:hypothetical protein